MWGLCWGCPRATARAHLTHTSSNLILEYSVRREIYLHKSLANKGHPYGGFHCGNLETLKCVSVLLVQSDVYWLMVGRLALHIVFVCEFHRGFPQMRCNTTSPLFLTCTWACTARRNIPYKSEISTNFSCTPGLTWKVKHWKLQTCASHFWPPHFCNDISKWPKWISTHRIWVSHTNVRTHNW